MLKNYRPDGTVLMKSSGWRYGRLPDCPIRQIVGLIDANGDVAGLSSIQAPATGDVILFHPNVASVWRFSTPICAADKAPRHSGYALTVRTRLRAGSAIALCYWSRLQHLGAGVSELHFGPALLNLFWRNLFKVVGQMTP